MNCLLILSVSVLRFGFWIWIWMRKKNIRLVGSAEADPMENRISDESPMGKGLIGGRINEEIDIEIPAGMMRLKILEISK